MAEINSIEKFKEQYNFAIALQGINPVSLTNRDDLLIDDISRIHRAGLILTEVFGFSAVQNISYVSGIPEQRVRKRLKHPYLALWTECKTIKKVRRIDDGKLSLYLPPKRGRPPGDEERNLIRRPMTFYAFHNSSELILYLKSKALQQYGKKVKPRDEQEKVGYLDKAQSNLLKNNIISLYDRMIETIEANPKKIIEKEREDIKMWERVAKLVKLTNPDRAEKIKLFYKSKSNALALCEEIDFPYEVEYLYALRTEKEFFEAIVSFTSDASITKAIKNGDTLDWKLK